MRLNPQALVGSTILLEPIMQMHYQGVKQAANHESIWAYMPFRADGDFFAPWFATLLQQHEQGAQLTYIMRRKTDNLILGGHSYYDIDLAHQRLEIGYSWIDVAYWGSAFIHEALWLLFSNAFETWYFNRIQIAADPRNKRSYNILRKLGAVEEGLLREHMLHHHGLVTDTVVFSILAREWPMVKQKLEQRLQRN